MNVLVYAMFYCALAGTPYARCFPIAPEMRFASAAACEATLHRAFDTRDGTLRCLHRRVEEWEP